MDLDKLSSFMKDINKTFGENAVIRVGDENVPKVETNRTGVLSFDLALGGGFGVGRIVELIGPESSGKTSLALMAISEAQKDGKACAIVDAEQALDFEYAKTLGVDLDSLIVNQPDNAEQALEILDRMISSELFSVIVLDSVAALSPKSELEGEMGDQRIGVLGKLMAQALRKLTAKISKTKTTVVFINQQRDLIGAYVPTKTTPGGNALRYFASQRVEITKGTQIKNGDEVLGGLMKIKVIKNKIFPPFKKAEVDMIFGVGVDKNKDILNLAVTNNIIQKSGSWYSYDDVKLGQGIDKVKELMDDNPEMMDHITEKLFKLVKK